MQRMMITVIVAFVLGAVIGKLLLPVLHKLKFGQNIYELAPEAHKKKQGTPTMGGLTFAAAAIVAGGRARTLADGLSLAFLSIDSGSAYNKLAAMVADSNHHEHHGHS